MRKLKNFFILRRPFLTFSKEEGYMKLIARAVEGLLKKCHLKINNFDMVAYTCPYTREHAAIGKSLGISPEKIQNNLMDKIGDTGAAYSLMMLLVL